MRASTATEAQSRDWDQHWRALDTGSIFTKIAGLVRLAIFQPAVRHYARTYFPGEGTLVEMGCGTTESSQKIPAERRTLVGLDFSLVALRRAQMVSCLNRFVCGDLRALPFRTSSISGIWNLGVMEHFERADLTAVLREFRRVLRPGGVIVLFWPRERNLSRWVLGPIEWLRSRTKGEPFRFFPDEVSRLRSKQHASELLEPAGFDIKTLDFSVRTLFIHMVVVATAVGK